VALNKYLKKTIIASMAIVIFFIGLSKSLGGVICVHGNGHSAFEFSFNGHDCFDKDDHHNHSHSSSINNADSCVDISFDYNSNVNLSEIIYQNKQKIITIFQPLSYTKTLPRLAAKLLFERLCFLKTIFLRL
jgi:hypothetical protein